MEVKNFATLEIDGMDPAALQFLGERHEKCEVLLQWIQRLIVEASLNGVVPIAPPILSRAFQELSRGIVNLNSAKRITDIPFPLPYTIMIRIMLVIQWIITPIVCSLVLDDWWWAGGLSMITIFAFTSTVHIAAEIENPFGDDQNDLPLADFQHSFNQSLLTLLDNRAQMPPFYTFQAEREPTPQNTVKHKVTTDLEWLNHPSTESFEQSLRYSNRHRTGMLDQSVCGSQGSSPIIMAHMPAGPRNPSGRRSENSLTQIRSSGGTPRGGSPYVQVIGEAGIDLIGEAGLTTSRAASSVQSLPSDPLPKRETKLREQRRTAPSLSSAARREGPCGSHIWWDDSSKSRSDEDEIAEGAHALHPRSHSRLNHMTPLHEMRLHGRTCPGLQAELTDKDLGI